MTLNARVIMLMCELQDLNLVASGQSHVFKTQSPPEVVLNQLCMYFIVNKRTTLFFFYVLTRNLLVNNQTLTHFSNKFMHGKRARMSSMGRRVNQKSLGLQLSCQWYLTCLSLFSLPSPLTYRSSGRSLVVTTIYK